MFVTSSLKEEEIKAILNEFNHETKIGVMVQIMPRFFPVLSRSSQIDDPTNLRPKLLPEKGLLLEQFCFGIIIPVKKNGAFAFKDIPALPTSQVYRKIQNAC